MKRHTASMIQQKKKDGQKIAMLTAYDYPTAVAAEEAGIEILLVGDSLGMVVLGYDSTVPVTVDDMVHHTRAVVRGSSQAHVVTDLPFMSYHLSERDALEAAGRVVQEGGAQSVKLEGGRSVADTVTSIVEAGIPVMGHLGLTPQSVHQLGGYRRQGKTLEAARTMVEEAKLLEDAGVYALVLESVPYQLADLIRRHLSVPVIGIGAGGGCDGQVLVIHDMLGVFGDSVPSFVRQYEHLKDRASAAIKAYIDEVETGAFPAEEHSFFLDDGTVSRLEKEMNGE